MKSDSELLYLAFYVNIVDFIAISKLAVLLSKNPPPPPNHKGITIIESKIIYKVTQKLPGSWLLSVANILSYFWGFHDVPFGFYAYFYLWDHWFWLKKVYAKFDKKFQILKWPKIYISLCKRLGKVALAQIWIYILSLE